MFNYFVKGLKRFVVFSSCKKMLNAQQTHKKVLLVRLVEVMFNNIFNKFFKRPKQLSMSFDGVTVSLDGFLSR